MERYIHVTVLFTLVHIERTTPMCVGRNFMAAGLAPAAAIGDMAAVGSDSMMAV